MKKLLLLSWCLFLSSVAWADLPPHWVSEELKTVFYLPTATLNVKLVKLEADPDYWDQLDLEVDYPVASLVAQRESLEKAFPNYKTQRVIAEKEGDVAVELLGSQSPVQLKMLNGQTGPYFRWTHFVSKSESAKVRASFLDSNFIVVRANIKANVPEMKVVERIEIGRSSCIHATGGVKTVFDLAKKSSAIINWVQKRTAKYATTLESLSDQMIYKCFVFGEQPYGPISFSELLGKELQLNEEIQTLAGETRSEVPTSQVLEFSHTQKKELL
jgi:hypothetical protein